MLHLLHVLLQIPAGAAGLLPGWLLSPSWLRPLERSLRHFVVANPGPGLYLMIFVEEIGIPTPIPGDVVIMSAGYLISIGRLPYAVGVLGVMLGSLTGGYLNYTISRRYGRVFLQRFGHLVGLHRSRLEAAEAQFRRWGRWAIILGRLIPGMRVILSAFSGAFGVRRGTFLGSVAISSAIWAFVFLELGRQLGRRTYALFRLVPAHLLPWIGLLVVLLVVAHQLLERRRAMVDPVRDAAPNLLNL